MVSQTRVRQRQQRRRKEHRLIVWMRNQQTYPLIPELREPRFRDRDRVQPAGDRDNRKAQDGQPFELHGCARYAVVRRERETGRGWRKGECRVLDKRRWRGIGEATVALGDVWGREGKEGLTFLSFALGELTAWAAEWWAGAGTAGKIIRVAAHNEPSEHQRCSDD